MNDILLVTVESLRWDYRDAVPAFEDLSVTQCQTAGHYTRPALAGLLAGSVADALAREPRQPTLPGVLADAGYQTVGVCHSPQTTERLGFGRGFETYHNSVPQSDGALSRGSRLREFLGSNALVRRARNFVQTKEATLSNITDDQTAAQQAVSAFEDTNGPVFAWVHLMESHRPYGWGRDALAAPVDRNAASASPSRLSPTVSDQAAESVTDAYSAALGRVSATLDTLLSAVDEDTVVAVVGDHGEEMGEEGYWYHGPYRRRVVETLTDVPLAAQNLSMAPRSAAALPAALAQSVGVSVPDAWHAPDDLPVTVAPWDGRASVRVGSDITLCDARFDVPEKTDGGVTDQLRALGYV